MIMAVRWTPLEDKILKQLLIHDKLTPQKILEGGKLPGRSKGAIMARKDRLNIRTRRVWSDEDTALLHELRGAGHTLRGISKETGWSERTLEDKVRDEGLTKPTGPRYILMKAGLKV